MAARKGPQGGTGGHGRRRLQGRGPTPKAERRTGHPAARRTSAAAPGRVLGSPAAPGRRPPRRAGDVETVAGRNPVLEALRAGVPASTLYVAAGTAPDARVSEALRLAADRGVALVESTRAELDRLADGAVHQGLALAVPAYRYAHPDDLLARAVDSGEPALLVALDGVSDPRNLGAVLRSAAAFGAHGVLVPQRRAAGMSAGAWKASAGAAARLPVARATNLVRALRAYADAGLLTVGLAADGEVDLADLDAAVDPLVLVVGAEHRGLSRLVDEACALRVRIPMAGGSESLNAAVAAGIVLCEVARRRR